MSREYFECHVSFQIAAGKKGEPPNGAFFSRVKQSVWHIEIIKLSVAFGDFKILTCRMDTENTSLFGRHKELPEARKNGLGQR